MVFERGYIAVDDMRFGRQTEFRDRVLFLDGKALSDFLRSRDDRIDACIVSIARPGDSTRILCVKDVIQPGCKVRGNRPGEGRSHVLENVAVVTCGKIVGYQEGIIDMSSLGALYSPFSGTLNVVLDIDVVPGLTSNQHEEAVRNAGLGAADFLGEAARSVKPEKVQFFEAPEDSTVSPDLPRVVYVYMLLSQGLLQGGVIMARKYRVIYCLNQFFGGLGGEDKAYRPPQLIDGARGPGILLEKLFPDMQVEATLVVGDNYVAEKTETAIREILALLTPLFEAKDTDKPHFL